MKKMRTRIAAIGMVAALSVGMFGTTAYAAGNRQNCTNSQNRVCDGTGKKNNGTAGVCDGTGKNNNKNGVCNGTGKKNNGTAGVCNGTGKNNNKNGVCNGTGSKRGCRR